MKPCVLLSLLCLTLFSTFVSAENSHSERVIMVFDASGSMWGQLKDKTKIEIAKEVVTDLVKDWNPDVELGLIAYGHRSKGDCKDIESIIAPGKLNPDTFTAKVEGINPRGMTPLSDAVIQAANELKYSENKATVILISDGIETCDRDPCKVGEELEQSGVDFTTHVVGFDLTKDEERAQLECLAKNTGGQFFSASDAASLKASLEQAVEQAVDPTGVKVFAVMKSGEEPLKDKVSWNVFLSEADAFGKRKQITYSYHASPVFHLDAGKYLIEAKHGNATTSREIEIQEGVSASEEFVLGAGEIMATAYDKEGGEALSKVSWRVLQGKDDGFNKQKQIAFSYHDVPLFSLPAGSYILEAKHGSALVQQEVVVEAGAKEEIAVILGAGEIKVAAFDKEGGTTLSKVAWRVLQGKDDGFNKPKQVTFSYDDAPVFSLPAGTYTIEAKRGSAVVEQEVHIEVGTKKEIAVVLGAGQVKIAAIMSEGGEPVSKISWEVSEGKADAFGKRKRVTYSYDTIPVFTLAAGEYYITAKRGAATSSTTLTVAAGEQKMHTIVLDAGEVKLKAVEESGGDAVKATWGIFEPGADDFGKRKQVTYSYDAIPHLILPKGKYLVAAKTGDRKSEQEIEVAAGDQKQIEVMLK